MVVSANESLGSKASDGWSDMLDMMAVASADVTEARAPVKTRDLINAMIDAIQAVPPCPLAKWMADIGYDPAAGWVVFLPDVMRDFADAVPPDFLRFTRLIQSPIFINTRNACMTI